MATLDHRIPPPIVGLLVAAAMWSVASLGPRVPLPSELRWTVVGTLVVAGLVFDLLGLVSFRRSRTTVNPLKPERSTALVTAGVYRVTRNPMYVGMALLLTAFAVHLAAILPLAGPVAFVLFITRFQIRPEERALEGLFGAPYAAYVEKVPRWL